jgi:hypothetical protein
MKWGILEKITIKNLQKRLTKTCHQANGGEYWTQ